MQNICVLGNGKKRQIQTVPYVDTQPKLYNRIYIIIFLYCTIFEDWDPETANSQIRILSYVRIQKLLIQCFPCDIYTYGSRDTVNPPHSFWIQADPGHFQSTTVLDPSGSGTLSIRVTANPPTVLDPCGSGSVSILVGII